MKFKTDENLPVEAALLLQEAGYACDTVLEEDLSGASDPIIALRVQEEERVLITLDLDFANIQAYPPGQYIGIIVLRSKSQDKPTILDLTQKLILLLRERTPEGELWIVQRNRIRIRRAD